MTTQERTNAGGGPTGHATIRVENKEPRLIILGDGGRSPGTHLFPSMPDSKQYQTDSDRDPTQRFRFLFSLHRKVSKGAKLTVEKRTEDGFTKLDANQLQAEVDAARMAHDEFQRGERAKQLVAEAEQRERDAQERANAEAEAKAKVEAETGEG